jgi:hypothetical protein
VHSAMVMFTAHVHNYVVLSLCLVLAGLVFLCF